MAVLEFSAKEHESVQRKMREQADRRVAEIPELLETLMSQLKSANPLGVLASFATYGLAVPAYNTHRQRESTLKNVQQHHVELLQALVSTIPAKDWGKRPLTPDVMQAAFDTVEKLSETFLFQRILSGQEISDEEKWLVSAMQERIRFYTFGVRNWGYFSDVVKIATELYGALDQSFSEKCGFSITELLEVMKCVINEYERRTNHHFETLSKVMGGRNPRELTETFWEIVPDLVGSAEEFLAAVPKNASRDSVAARLMAHLDLRLADRAIFKADEIAALTGHPVDIVARILRAVSKPPGALVGAKFEHLFLNNPVWASPGIDLDGCFFFVIPQAVFSHVHSLVYCLCEEAGLKESLETARSNYLETKLGEALAAALPGATIHSNAKWRSGDQEFENDFLAILDRTLVIAEAKSHRVTPEGLRGAPERLKRHVKDLVLAPSIQSKRLQDRVAEAQEGDRAAIASVSGLGIDPSKVDRVVRLSVTLEELPLLSSAELELKRIGWVPADHQLAPSIPISDLLCIIDILDNPILILHYLSERSYVQKTFNLSGIEPEFLGLYLETGFTIPELEDPSVTLWITEWSQHIDRYFESLTNGKRATKPKPKLSPLFLSIIAMLDHRRPNGWTTLGLHLLSSPSFGEQRALERELEKLRKSVRRNSRNPQHKNAFHIPSREKRRAEVAFHLYPRAMTLARKKVMQDIGYQVLDSSSSSECCVIAKCIDEWEVPYHAACVIKNRKSPKSAN